jgi:hypothetical protein
MSLYRKSRRTTRLPRCPEPSADSVPQNPLHPQVRIALFEQATGNKASVIMGGGSQLATILDAMDRNGIPYPTLDMRL